MASKKNSVMVRIPVELKERLDALCAQVNESYESGRMKKEVKLTEQGSKGTWIPMHEIIRLALDEMEDHKARSRKSRKSAKPAVEAVA